MKAKEAVPLLLKRVEYPEIIESLAAIGDPAALPAIREIVAAKGQVVRDGEAVFPELNGERLIAAKMAEGAWDADGGVARFCEMLGDETLDRQQRRDLIFRLAAHPDPRAIPSLVRVVKKDEDSFVVEMAIRGLAEFRYKAAVEGLIECFDVEFKETGLGKGLVITATECRNSVARSLQRITGESFGADKQQWLTWWNEKGKRSDKLK